MQWKRVITIYEMCESIKEEFNEKEKTAFINSANILKNLLKEIGI